MAYQHHYVVYYDEATGEFVVDSETASTVLTSEWFDTENQEWVFDRTPELEEAYGQNLEKLLWLLDQ